MIGNSQSSHLVMLKAKPGSAVQYSGKNSVEFRYWCAKRLQSCIHIDEMNLNARDSLPLPVGFRDTFRPSARLTPGLILALAVLLAGCATVKPDLERLYAATREGADQTPVIVIPGLLGSKMRHRDTGEEVWPGGLFKVLFSDYQKLALPIDPETLEPVDDGLEPFEITDKAIGRDFYGAILRTLEGPGGYVRGEPGEAVTGGGRRYYVFTYDWRQDMALMARDLGALVDQVRVDHGNPDLKVDVVAHSMGGLLARYYIRYGDQDVLGDNEFPVSNDGGKRIRRVVLLGTPNLGSVRTVQSFIQGKPVGFNRIPPEVIATMPGAYQLLPHGLHDWLITSDGRTLERDQFEARIWRRFEWAIYDPEIRNEILSRFDNADEAESYWQTLDAYFEKQLKRARRFTWSLTVPLPEVHVRHVVFGGDCHLTPARLLVEEIEGESVIRLWPDEIEKPLPGVDYDRLMLEPGDEAVTKSSLLARDALDPRVPRHPHSFFPLDYAFFLCEPHTALTGNIHFRDNLLHVLLSQD